MNYPPEARPFVEVMHTDGAWYPGRLHAWVPDGPGWRAVVSYHVAPGVQHYLDVPSERVRRMETGPPPASPRDDGLTGSG
ncbi:MAG: hypothetical protein GXX79_22265 [Actinomycetales bacterium]|nr:hypothetical protein [Actinomycetales bacterium]